MGNSPSSLADHPLHDAKKGKWQDYFGKLNNSKVSVNDAVPKTGWTALHFAAREADAEVIAKLIVKGAQVETACAKGRSPLMEAVRHKNLGAVQCLLKHGADVNFQDSNGDTCYHLAVEKGAREMIDVLSEEGADLNLQNKNGWAPLHTAALLHRYDCAVRLVDFGASLTVRTKNGTLPVDIADNSGCIKIADWLSKTMSNSYTATLSSGETSSESSLRSASVLSNRTTVAPASPATSFLPGKAKSLSIASQTDDVAVATITEQLKPIFEDLKMDHLLGAAALWCVQQGADTLEDVKRDAGCVDDLADVLDLPRIKRNKFLVQMASPSNDLAVASA